MNDLGIFTSLDISAAGLSAQRLRMNVISNNIANAGTTKTPDGGPYRRQVVNFQQALDGPQILVPAGPEHASGGLGPDGRNARLDMERFHVLPAGVEVGEVQQDKSDFQTIYDPTHPDADADGNVKMPNVNPVVEMMDLMGASRAYEANVTAMTAARDMATKTLDIGR
jgi:flagellar basal-body rod protein FlgC